MAAASGRASTSRSLRFIVQRPDGTFQTQMPYLGPEGAFIDINGDGRPDVLQRLTFVRIMAPQ